ncbi:MAG: NAD(P)-dependent oxidoreductase, partial [Chloroflexi bacterium]
MDWTMVSARRLQYQESRMNMRYDQPLKVLVTGASGFVGRHLCRHFIEMGYDVRGTCRSSSPILEELPDVEWIRISDISPNTNWSEALDGVQYVVHLAALAHQVGKKGKGRFDEFMRVNAEGTRRLAEQCKF